MATGVVQKKKETIAALLESADAFRFCGPSDDPDEQTAVTSGYRHLVIQLQRLAGPLLSPALQARLNSINVEIDNLYSAYDAHSEITALMPDLQALLDDMKETAFEVSADKRMKPQPLPVPVCSVVGSVLGNYMYHHKTLENLFYQAGATGEVPEGNCVVKCQSWLKRMHKDVADPTAVLGKILEEFMEVDNPYKVDDQTAGRKSITEVLARHALSYRHGGFILGAQSALPTKSLTQVLKDRDLGQVDKEFERALANLEPDPPASIAAASSILESLFKVYIEDHGLDLPTDQSLKPLWKTASKHIGFDPSALADEDLKKILSGLNSIVDGIASLRTHASTAHGQGKRPYRVQVRHARLAIHASHTLVNFFLETWDERKKKAAP